MNNQNTYQQQVPPQMGQGQMMPSPPMTPPVPPRGRLVPPGARPQPRGFSMHYTTYAIIAYLIGLFGVVILAAPSGMVMNWYWWAFGIVEVVGFFVASSVLSRKWARLKSKTFEKNLFWTSLVIRAVVVIFLYWFFYTMRGDHLMFSSADETFYIDMATYGASLLRDGHWGTFFPDLMDFVNGQIDIGDMGYPVWLSLVYFFTGDSLLLSRLINAVLGAYTCVLIYRVATRNFGEDAGRMSAIFCLLMPNLIYYCGINLKEVGMICLIAVFLNSADKMIHAKQPSFKIYILPMVSALLLFTFRNVLGLTAIMALGLSLFLSNVKTLNLSRRLAVLVILLSMGAYFVGGKIFMEAERMWNNRETSQELRLQERSFRSKNSLIEKASAAVFAPMIFTLPFPTMVETEGQETFRMIHGGLVVKNIMSGFTIFALFLLILEGGARLRARWREHVLILAMLIGYLVILTVSAFAHAERFHLPIVPLELMLAAYGVTRLTKRQQYMYTIWCVIMVVAMIGWNWFKLKGRGMI